MPWGEGFVGICLVLPHRSALVASDPLALAPDQVMNRYVRGILAACELSGIPVTYPGRDLVTVERRPIAMVSFEVDAGGALLFEAVLADARDFSELPALLDRVDPGGVVRAQMLTPADTTSVARRIGRCLGVEELAARLRRGYEERLGVRFTERTLATPPDFDDQAWLAARRLRPGLDRHGSLATQLGVLEAHFSLEAGRLRDVVLAGDFIASSAAVERLQDALRGCPAERAAIEAMVDGVLGAPGSFVLGIGAPRAFVDAIVRGLPA